MSLNRVTSLESREIRPAVHRHQTCSKKGRRRSSASSGHSAFSKVNFNPASGSPWNKSPMTDDTEEDQLRNEDLSPQQRLEDNGRPNAGNWKSATDSCAFEVPKWRRIAQVVVAVIYCLLSAGIIFGYAALKPLLIREGVYRDRCTEEELRNGEKVCYGQDLRLNFMFTLAVVATNVCALPAGTVLDIYGPRVSGVIGGIFLTLGALLFSLGSHLPFDGYLPGFLCFGLGGSFVFLSSFQLSNTFPKHSGLILSLLTGAFDASSVLFLIFRLLYGGWLTIQNLFSLYLVVPGLILVSQIFLMPSTSYKGLAELVQEAKEAMADESAVASRECTHETTDEGAPLRNDILHRQTLVANVQGLLDEDLSGNRVVVDDSQDLEFGPQSKKSSRSIQGVMHTASAIEQISSPWFILISIFTLLQMLRTNYFVATLRLQYEYLLSSYHLAKKLNHVFDIFLPLAGVVSIPFIGTILDKAHMTTILLTLVFGTTLIGILGCIPHSLTAAYANIILFTLYRPFFYTTISDYAAKVFGFQSFGKVYGLLVCLAGLGNFIQSPLDVLTYKVFRGNPIPVNIVLTVVVFVAGAVMVSFVWWQAREWQVPTETVLESGEGEGAIFPAEDNAARETDRLLFGSRSNGAEASTSYNT